MTFFRVVAVVLVLAFSSPCFAEPFELTILHTNDTHARIASANKYGGSCSSEEDAEGKCFGGAARLAAAVAQRRSQDTNTLLLNAGDAFQGTLYFTAFHGDVLSRFMNTLQYTAMTLGNHEFDEGVERLEHFIEQLQFPVTVCNVLAPEIPALQALLTPYVILDVGGRMVGLTGAITPETATLSKYGGQVQYQAPAAALRRVVAELQAKDVDIIIAMTHLGYHHDLALAKQVPGLDVIVGGHSHTLLSNESDNAAGPYPTVVENGGAPVLVVTAGSWTKYLGELHVAFDDSGAPVKWKGEPILLDSEIAPAPDVAAQVAEYTAKLHKKYDEVVGETTTPLGGEKAQCRSSECLAGNLVTDAMLRATAHEGAQIALFNAGGVRAGIPKGKITLGQVVEAFPFNNTVATFELQGKYLLEALEHSLSRVSAQGGTGRFLQMSGMKLVYDPQKSPGERVVSAEVRDASGKYAPVDPSAMYKIATNDYLYGGGDEYSMLTEHMRNGYAFGAPVQELLVEFIGEKTPLSLELDGRISLK